MRNKLVIVESPTKARTLRRFLGRDYVVDSSVGHIRDLPAKAADIPPSLKKERWARLGVNVEQGFAPLYVLSPDKKKKIQELKEHLKSAESVLLATDEDREGEAISWHLVEVLKPKVPTRRMVFHEITREAIQESLGQTREIDQHLVDAQEARRIVDRLYGYEVSPILWRKIAPRLSAGRVQSVAVRMLVEREQARMRFRQAEYWDLSAEFATQEDRCFGARLISVNGKRVAGGKDFDPETGQLARSGVVQLREGDAHRLCERLRPAEFRVLLVEEKPYSQSPAPPFTTSTLQQEGNRKLRFDARRTMRAAQRLYESGYITYMRTDSVALSEEALRGARRSIRQLYGTEFLPETPRGYSSRVKNAQEAHEAIRPAGDEWPRPESLTGELGGDELRVYELIWKRTLACQMTDARGRRVAARIGAQIDGTEVVFVAGGPVVEFPGFLRVYHEDKDEGENGEERESVLPPLRQGERVFPRRLEPEGHTTQPPPRLTEASLIKSLEESGIGRPSTYASIIDTILRREYTFKKGTALVPTFSAFAVVGLMKEHLPDLIDYEFTARMEDRLDAIARGEEDRLPYLREFYHGNGSPGLRPILDHKVEAIDPRAACTIPIPRETEEQTQLVVRVGRYGPYLQRADGEGPTAPLPDGICPDEMRHARASELLAQAAQGPQALGTHPETQQPVYVKNGRYGPYVQLGDAEPKVKPKMVSLLPGMSPESVSLEEALRLLALPRILGADEEGREIVAHLGRFGPYIKRGDDTRSLDPEDDILSITRERALELLAREKRGRSFRAAPRALKEFPSVAALEGRTVRLLAGRFGLYLTDGDTNASLPRDLPDPSAVTEEQAVALILERRANPRQRRRTARRRSTSRKSGSKATTGKKVRSIRRTDSSASDGEKETSPRPRRRVSKSSGQTRKTRPAADRTSGQRRKPDSRSATERKSARATASGRSAAGRSRRSVA